MFYVLIILLQAFFARAAGGGFGAVKLNSKKKGGVMPFGLTMLPEICFGIVAGFVFYTVTDSLLWSSIVAIWVYGWQETGVMWMPGKADRHHTLTPVVNWISNKLGFEIGDWNYCRTFLAVKGFMISLPFGGFILAVLQPLAYHIGYKLDTHAAKEILAGASFGIALCLFKVIFST